MKIFIIGGTGFIGRNLLPSLLDRFEEIRILSRNKKRDYIEDSVEQIIGNGYEPEKWKEHLEWADIIINLSGINIATFWSAKVKQEIYDSRIKITKNIIDNLPENNNKTLINASAIGYYGYQKNETLKENSQAGTDFLAKVCIDWEKEAKKAKNKGTRIIITRFGIALGSGGALEKIAKVFKNYIGGKLGSGKQWFSWIHVKDLVKAILFLIDNKESEGIYNITSPNPVTNLELTKTIGKTLKVPTILPAPAAMIKFALGEFSDVVLKGQKVIPRKLEKEGFTFNYPQLEEAILDLVRNYRL